MGMNRRTGTGDFFITRGVTNMTHLKAFITGFVSTLVFHQDLLWLLHAGGVSPWAPGNMTQVPPLNVPAVISLAFWGGVWGIVLWGPDSRFARRWLLGQGPCDRCAGPEPRRMVRSDANQGHGLRRRLGFEDHRRRLAAERRLGTRRRAADAAAFFLSCVCRAIDEGGAMNKFVIRFG